MSRAFFTPNIRCLGVRFDIVRMFNYIVVIRSRKVSGCRMYGTYDSFSDYTYSKLLYVYSYDRILYGGTGLHLSLRFGKL